MGGLLMKRWGVPSATSPGLPAPNPDFANVRLLCGFNGADGATAFTDERTLATCTFVGNAQLDTAQKKFGTASLLLDGSGDVVTQPDSGNWNIGASDDFQLEAFVRWPSGASFAVNQTFFSQWDSPSVRAFRFALDSDGLLKFQYSTDGTNTSTAVSGSWTPSTDTWYHVAFVRVSGVSRVFVDGTVLAESSVSNYDPFTSSEVLRIGANASGGSHTNFVNGWMDECRIAKYVGGGSAGKLYSENFIAPQAAFPRS